MSLVAIIIFIILMLTALIHAAWGFGLLWPGTDQQSLVNTVIGEPGMTHIPPLPLTLTVAFAIAAAGICALWGANLIQLPLPQWMQKTSSIVLALIFAIRGVATYIPNSLLSKRAEPFATLNHNYFAPLILSFATGYAYIYFSNYY